MRKIIEDAQDFADPLDDLVERAKTDPGAAFESEVLEQLAEVRRGDPSRFERLIARLKKETKCRITELMDNLNRLGDDEDGQETQADVLVQLAKDQCKFFHDEVGATYATLSAPHDGGTHHETHKLRSKGLRLWLIRSYYLGTGGVPNDTALKSAIALLEAFARFDGPQRDVFVRRAAHAGKLYVAFAMTAGAQSRSTRVAGASLTSLRCCSCALMGCWRCLSQSRVTPKRGSSAFVQ